MYTFKFKRLFVITGFIFFNAGLLLLLIGCSGTPTILERAIKVPVVTTIHDTIMLRDTVINQDTLWSSKVVDSLNTVIGWLKVNPNKKAAELKITKKNTAVIIDTVFISKEQNMIPVVVDTLSWWEKLIFYGGLGAIISLLIALRIKRGKV